MEGFLGTGAPLWADLNLVMQFAMALALGWGVRVGRERLHGLQLVRAISVGAAVVSFGGYAVRYVLR